MQANQSQHSPEIVALANEFNLDLDLIELSTEELDRAAGGGKPSIVIAPRLGGLGLGRVLGGGLGLGLGLGRLGGGLLRGFRFR